MESTSPFHPVAELLGSLVAAEVSGHNNIERFFDDLHACSVQVARPGHPAQRLQSLGHGTMLSAVNSSEKR